jgi:hypothetical protein
LIGERDKDLLDPVVIRMLFMYRGHLFISKIFDFEWKSIIDVCRGEPITQNYRNTDITLSNVRINDELYVQIFILNAKFIDSYRMPAPFHTTDLTPHQIPLKFPSNHPFSSHISEKAVFPNASFSLDDRPSTDTDPYIVTHKTRGRTFFLLRFNNFFSIKVIHIVAKYIITVYNDLNILNGPINSICRSFEIPKHKDLILILSVTSIIK